jgi:uncharacterized protein YceK
MRCGLLSLLFSCFALASCGSVVKKLDSSQTDEQTVYQKCTPLPPLEIPSELAPAAID